MENVTEAMIMAASVLLLIIALSVAISSFTTLRTQMETVFSEREEVLMATDEDGNYINYIENGDDVRTVGIEDILVAYRRMRKEDYIMYIYDSGQDYGSIPNDLLVKFSEDYKYKPKENSPEEEIIIPKDKNVIRLVIDINYVKELDETINLLYNNIKDAEYKEYFGIYKETVGPGVLDKENLEHKIITFVR